MKLQVKLRLIVGQCAPFFFMAVVFDIVGLIVLIVGLCANPQISGRFYGDFLVYTGSILIFISLGVWVMWYTGNIMLSDEMDEEPVYTGTFKRLSSKITLRTSSVKKVEDTCIIEHNEEEEEEIKKVELEEEVKNEEKMEEEEEEKKGAGEEDNSQGYVNEAYEPTDTEKV